MAVKRHNPWKRFSPQDKIRVFGAGVRFAVSSDPNLAVQLILSLAVLVVTFWLREWLDFVLIVVVTGLMLIVEMINTVFEALCDYIQPEWDDRIGAIKDIAAAASGIAILLWTVSILYEAARIWALLY